MARRRRVRSAPRRAYGRFRRRVKSSRFPLSFAPAIAVPIGSMLFGNPGAATDGIVKYAQTGGLEGAAHEAMNVIPYELIGYKWDGTGWDWSIWARNIGLILGGWGMHTVANKTGLNRQMARVPLIGKYLSI